MAWELGHLTRHDSAAQTPGYIPFRDRLVVMRLVVFPIALALSACASRPQTELLLDNCLTDESDGWVQLATPPADSAVLRSLAKSPLANPPTDIEEHWYSSGDQLLYCRRESWCIAETWTFVQSNAAWQVVDQHSWICVTSHNNSFKGMPLRGTP